MLYIPMILEKTVNKAFDSVGFKRYFLNTSWMFVGKMLNLVINFIVSIFVARYLGPERYGLMSFIVSFASITMTLGDLGIDSLLIKEMNQKPEADSILLGTGLFIKFFGAIISISSCIIIATFFQITAPLIGLLLAYASFVIFQSFNVIDFYFQSRVKVKYSNIVLVIVSTFSAILELSFIFFHFGVFSFLLIYPIQYFLLAIGYIYFYLRLGNRVQKWQISSDSTSYLIKNSWPFILSNVSTAIYFRIDQVLLRVFMGPAIVGIYAIAANLSEPWSFIPSVICSSLFPAIINAKKTNQVVFGKRMAFLYTILFYTALCIALPISVLSPFIISILYGKAYAGSAILLSIYIWSLVGMFLTIGFQQYLVAEQKLKIIFLINFCGMVINVALNLILIPRIGASGAAISNVVSYLLPLLIIFILPQVREQGKILGKALFLRFN